MALTNSIERKKEDLSVEFQSDLTSIYQALNEQLITAFYSVMYISQSEPIIYMSTNNNLTASELYLQTITAQAEIGKFISLYAMPKNSTISAFYLNDNNSIAFDNSSSFSISTFCDKIGQTQTELTNITSTITHTQLKNSSMEVANINDEVILQYYFRVGDKTSKFFILLQIPAQTILSLFEFENLEALDISWILSSEDEIFIKNATDDIAQNLFDLTNKNTALSHHLSTTQQINDVYFLSGAFEATPLRFTITYRASSSINSEDYIIYVSNLILSLIVSILLSRFVAQILYRPIVNILHSLNIDITANNKDEFLKIADVHNKALSDVTHLNNELLKQQNRLNSRYLSECLLHTHPQIEQTNMNKNSDYFVALVSYPSQQFPRDNFINSKHHFYNVFDKYSHTTYIADTSFISFAVIFENISQQEALNLLKTTAGETQQESDCALKIALSPFSGNISSLNKQYLECVNILEFKNHFINDLILTKEMLPTNSSERFSFPFDQEQDLIQLSSSGNQAAISLLQNIFNENFINKDLRITEYHNLFFALLFTFRYIIYVNQIDVTLPTYETILAKTRKRELALIEQSLIVILQEIIKQINHNKIANNTTTTKTVANFIALHYSQDVSLDDLATELGISKKYCSSLFKKSTGNTFKKQLNAYRIDVAKNILKQNPKTKISDIAPMVGFTSANTFIQVFKQYVGTTPFKYAINPNEFDYMDTPN